MHRALSRPWIAQVIKERAFDRRPDGGYKDRSGEAGGAVGRRPLQAELLSAQSWGKRVVLAHPPNP